MFWRDTGAWRPAATASGSAVASWQSWGLPRRRRQARRHPPPPPLSCRLLSYCQASPLWWHCCRILQPAYTLMHLPSITHTPTHHLTAAGFFRRLGWRCRMLGRRVWAEVKLEWPLLKPRLWVIIPCLIFQYVHAIFTGMACEWKQTWFD